MTASEAAKTSIRLVQYRDLEAIEALALQESPDIEQRDRISLESQIIALRRWFGLYKVLSLFPNPLRYHFCVYVAEAFTPSGAEAKKGNQLQGVIRVSPFNISRTTWRVEQVMVDTEESLSDPKGIASQLLRYCFESIWEVRTWILEVNIQQKMP